MATIAEILTDRERQYLREILMLHCTKIPGDQIALRLLSLFSGSDTVVTCTRAYPARQTDDYADAHDALMQASGHSRQDSEQIITNLNKHGWGVTKLQSP